MAAETQSTTATTETTGAEGHGQGGLPQFQFEYWGAEIIQLLIFFALLYALLAWVFTPRLRRVIDEREQTISDAVEAARRVQTEADEQRRAAQSEVDEARGRAQRVALEARAKVATQAAERQAAEEAKVNARIADAEAQIRAARDAAMGNVGAIASDTAAAIIEKLTGKPASAADIAAAMGGR
jgi:F-type H+-transporting ATPase subunit b